MSVHPRLCQVGTTWAGNFVVDGLLLPLNGSNDVATSSISGSLHQEVLSATYAAGLLTLAFTPQTIQAGCTVVPSLKLGTGGFLDVAVETISTAAQQIQIRFRTAAGGAASPPAGANGAELELAIFRPLPYR